MPAELSICAGCGKDCNREQRCPICRQYFCGRACFKASWSTHKATHVDAASKETPADATNKEKNADAARKEAPMVAKGKETHADAMCEEGWVVVAPQPNGSAGEVPRRCEGCQTLGAHRQRCPICHAVFCGHACFKTFWRAHKLTHAAAEQSALEAATTSITTLAVATPLRTELARTIAHYGDFLHCWPSSCGRGRLVHIIGASASDCAENDFGEIGNGAHVVFITVGLVARCAISSAGVTSEIRGSTYQDYVSSEGYRLPDIAVLAAPHLTVWFYAWAPVLHRLASLRMPVLSLDTAAADVPLASVVRGSGIIVDTGIYEALELEVVIWPERSQYPAYRPDGSAKWAHCAAIKGFAGGKDPPKAKNWPERMHRKIWVRSNECFAPCDGPVCEEERTSGMSGVPCPEDGAHSMSWTTKDDRTYQEYSCGMCRKKKRGLRWHCSLHQRDICEKCQERNINVEAAECSPELAELRQRAAARAWGGGIAGAAAAAALAMRDWCYRCGNVAKNAEDVAVAGRHAFKAACRHGVDKEVGGAVAAVAAAVHGIIYLDIRADHVQASCDAFGDTCAKEAGPQLKVAGTIASHLILSAMGNMETMQQVNEIARQVRKASYKDLSEIAFAFEKKQVLERLSEGIVTMMAGALEFAKVPADEITQASKVAADINVGMPLKQFAEAVAKGPLAEMYKSIKARSGLH
eukprot:NODE_1887_length_2345_cov_3.623986.p1 GENE.NODE_1887_length_2345_cov_3.623986~~NODE_1887_length_2345_cov_3.623986.p1  ORF type:complete len:695 (+),score=200.74 NODE_1887_length_2345_cov_3.623986:194-2278(+)